MRPDNGIPGRERATDSGSPGGGGDRRIDWVTVGTIVAMMATMIGTIVVVLFGAGQFLVSHLSDINANVNSGMTRVESAIDGLKDDVDDLRTDVNSIKVDVGDLRADVGGLKEDVDGLKESLAD